MKSFHRLLAAVVFVVCGLRGLALDELRPDPAARFGTLPNGVRYVIYPNKEPRGRASLRLLVSAGSFNETEDQRGLAHFLEHMAFNGGKHYAPGTLVEFFQRMGMSFGGDTNAFTNFDRTQYMLELPHTDEATLGEGLDVFADDAGGLLLPDDKIEKERGIILSEKRTRDNVAFRTFVAQFDFMLGDTLLPKRIPIGLPAVIEQAKRDRFADFWNTWYRPEKITVIAVGDFDPALVEKLIVARFTPLAARAPARPDPVLGALPKFEGVRAHFHAEPESPATSVSLTSITADPDLPDTAANRVKELPRQLALAMLNRRFSELAKKEGAPFSAAGASVEDQFHFMREAGVNLTCKPDQWAAALAVGEQELRRALEHGFQPGELKEVVATFTNGLDQAVKTAATRHSGPLANEIADGIIAREVFTHPEDDRALLQPALDRVTAADCLAALRSAFAAPGRFVMVSGNATMAGDANAAILAAYEKSRATAVAAPAAQAEAVWGYSDWGAPGTVAKREHVADLDVELVTFANGVHLNLKKTDFEAGRIRVGLRVGNGSITEPAGQPGLAALASGTFGAGGLGKHSVDELRRILAGRNVGARFQPVSDAFDFTGGTTPADLPLELQLLAAELTDAGWRPEALRQAQKGIEQMYLGFEHTANGPMNTEVANLLAGGDPRFGLPDKATMLSRNLAEAKAWLAPELAHGAIEISLVGDLDLEAAIEAVAKTLGALPARAAKPDLAALKKVSFPATPFVKSYTIASEIPKGNVAVYWPTTDGLEVHRARRLSLLAAVLGDRLRVKIREEIGGTYSPSAGSNASDTFPGYGYIQAGCVVDPALAAKISDLIVAIGDDLAQNGVTEDELVRAKQPVLTAARESLRTNNYWGGNVLARAQEKPEVLDWARTRLPDLEAITAAELSALAKSYLGKDRASRVTILPASDPKTVNPAPTATPPPATAALPAPAGADEEFAAINALKNTRPPAAPKEMGLENYFRWMDETRQKLTGKAFAFFDAHPNDPRRWEAVMAAASQPPLFAESFGPDLETKGMAAIVADQAARSAWQARMESFKDSLLASADAPVALREMVEWGRFGRDFVAQTRAKQQGKPFDYEPFKARFVAHVTKYAGQPTLGDRAADYLGALENNLPGTSLAEWTKLLDSPDEGLRDRATKQVAALKRQAEMASKPFELAFTAVDGRAVDLAKLRGKVVLIDFWATWCGPCVAELPNVKRVYAAYHDKGFEVVGISLENGQLLPKDTPEQMAAKLDKAKKVLTDFTTTNAMPWPQYFDGKWWKNDVSTQYDIKAIPAMFLLDQDGKVVSTNARGEKLEQEVKRLLKL